MFLDGISNSVNASLACSKKSHGGQTCLVMKLLFSCVFLWKP